MAEAAYIDWPSELGFILPELHRFTHQPHVTTPMQSGGVRRRPDGPPIEYFGDQIRVDEAIFETLKRLEAECKARRRLISLTAPDTGEHVAGRFIPDPQSDHGVLEIIQSATVIEGDRQTKNVVVSFALQVVRTLPET